jgi:hypothetical protein
MAVGAIASAHPSLRCHSCRAASLIIAAPFSAIMIVGAFVLVEVTAGITAASTTRSPSSPCTRNFVVDNARRVRTVQGNLSGHRWALCNMVII